jgi:cell division protein FtsW
VDFSLENQEQGTPVRGRIDYVFFWCVIILSVFGFFMDFSASFVSAREAHHDSYFFIKKHLIFGFMGLGAMMLLGNLDYKKLQKWVFPIFVITFVLLILTLIPGVGKSSHGARRWIALGPISFQTSEFAKYAIILFLSNYYYKYMEHRDSLKKFIITPLIFIVPMLGLVILQPNLSTTMLLGFVAFSIIFAAGAKTKHIVLFVVIGLAAVVAVVAYKQMVSPGNYWMDRIQSFMDPWKDPKGKGMQIIQSFMAFNSGGFWGAGIGKGMQKLLYLPEAHNDFIFAVIAEELGFFGVLATLSCFFILIYRGIRIALKAKDLFARLLVFGIMFMISVQVLFNVGVVLGLLPVTGLALPFVSYGGTALISFMGFMGIVLNVSRSIEK